MDRRNCYTQLRWKFLSSFSNTRKWIPFSLPSPLNSVPLLWSQLGEPCGGQNPACYQHCLPSPLLISNKCQDLSIWSPKSLSSPATSPPPLADLGLHHYACRLQHSANWFFWALLCWLIHSSWCLQKGHMKLLICFCPSNAKNVVSCKLG